MRPEYNKPFIGRRIEPYGEVFYANPYKMTWAERRELLTLSFAISEDKPLEALDTSEQVALKMIKGFNGVVDPSENGKPLEVPKTIEELRALPGLLVEVMIQQATEILQKEVEVPKGQSKR